ncbi:MAG TPA: hypothetical protein DCE18_05270, partial [Syntrophobacteraceae bacterium]|nr:hypothetical protein [Syntrophobacteraceae bacterium]
IDNGKIRLAGQVTVRIDELTRGLRELGLIVSAPVAEADRSPTYSPADKHGRVTEPDQHAGGETEDDSAYDEQSDDGRDHQAGQVPKPAAETQVAKNVMVLWFVAERWEQTTPWHIPGSEELGSAVQALFAGSVRQEAQAMPWTLVLPDAGLEILATELDVNRNFPVDQALKRAQDKNVRAVVIGTATQLRQAGGQVNLVADLNLLDAISGERSGQVRREITLAQLANTSDYAEEIIKLAAWVTPELDQLVRAGFAGRSSAATHEPQEEPVTVKPQPPAQVHGWVLLIRGIGSLAQWQELEQFLRQRYKDMEVVGLEYGAGNARVQLHKVGDDLPGVLKESQLTACRVEVVADDTAKRTIHLTFVAQDSAQ